MTFEGVLRVDDPQVLFDRLSNGIGPQVITVRGKEAAVVLSIEDYGELTRRKESLLEFFRRSPLRGVDLDITRDQDFGRDVDL